jgi:hypothetical protein
MPMAALMLNNRRKRRRQVVLPAKPGKLTGFGVGRFGKEPLCAVRYPGLDREEAR